MNGYLYEMSFKDRKHYYFLGSNKTRRNKQDATKIFKFLLREFELTNEDLEKMQKSIDMIYNKMQQVKLNYYINYYGIRAKDCGFTLDIEEVTVINEDEIFTI